MAPFSAYSRDLAMSQTIAIEGISPSRVQSGIGIIQTYGFSLQNPSWIGRNLYYIINLFGIYPSRGITYGGDGQTTFRLPDLSGRAAIGAGTGLAAIDPDDDAANGDGSFSRVGSAAFTKRADADEVRVTSAAGVGPVRRHDRRDPRRARRLQLHRRRRRPAGGRRPCVLIGPLP